MYENGHRTHIPVSVYINRLYSWFDFGFIFFLEETSRSSHSSQESSGRTDGKSYYQPRNII